MSRLFGIIKRDNSPLLNQSVSLYSRKKPVTDKNTIVPINISNSDAVIIQNEINDLQTQRKNLIENWENTDEYVNKIKSIDEQIKKLKSQIGGKRSRTLDKTKSRKSKHSHKKNRKSKKRN